jgi:hypothetical protein
MNAFIKIGLPWALSLALVFYLGLHLGSNVEKFTTPPPASSAPKKQVNALPKENDRENLIQIQKTNPTEFVPEENPAMPPNLQRIMQGGDIVERLGSYLDAVRSMDRSNVKQVVKAFEELPEGYGRHLEMKLLMRSWVNFDPGGALYYASNSLNAKSEKRFGISEALAGWVVRDEKAAIAWAQANHSGQEKGDNPLLVGIVKGLMETDLDAANRLFLSLPIGTARWQASSLLAEKFAKQDPQKAIQWAKNYPSDDPRMRETVLGQIGAKLSRQDLEATANWAKSMAPEPGTDRVTENLIAQWASRDPQAAAEWTNNLTNPERKRHAMAELSGRWALTDPVATAEWLNTQPLSPQLDPAIANFVSRIQGRNPEGAAGWAQSISDPTMRKKALDRALDAWLQTDPTKAEAWIKQQKE